MVPATAQMPNTMVTMVVVEMAILVAWKVGPELAERPENGMVCVWRCKGSAMESGSVLLRVEVVEKERGESL